MESPELVGSNGEVKTMAQTETKVAVSCSPGKDEAQNWRSSA